MVTVGEWLDGSFESQNRLEKAQQWFDTQGLAVIFSHRQGYMLKEKGGHFFAAQSESRISAPFFASKTV